MAATEDLDVEAKFFTWRTALFGRWDIFHLHWPEHLIAQGGGVKATLRRVLAKNLIRRIARKNIPVVRTLHNITPHSAISDSSTEQLHASLEALTKFEVHLVPEPDRVATVPSRLVPHGGYREPYSLFPRAELEHGRALYFGLIKSYKGVPALLSASKESALLRSLRIIGAPIEPEVVADVKAHIASDSRVSAEFSFVTDEVLVTEVTRSELVVLPYSEFHSSGVAIVSLSLGRPVLVPRSSTTESLAAELGDEWVIIYDGELSAEKLDNALRVASRTLRDELPPEMSFRYWNLVRREHRDIYAELVGRRQ